MDLSEINELKLLLGLKNPVESMPRLTSLIKTHSEKPANTSSQYDLYTSSPDEGQLLMENDMDTEYTRFNSPKRSRTSKFKNDNYSRDSNQADDLESENNDEVNDLHQANQKEEDEVQERVLTFKDHSGLELLNLGRILSQEYESPTDMCKTLIEQLIDEVFEIKEQRYERLLSDKDLVEKKALFIKESLQKFEDSPNKHYESTLTKTLSRMGSSDKNLNDLGFSSMKISASDPNAQKLKVYLFETPKSLKTTVSKTNTIADVISHILAVYKRDESLCSEKPLIYPDHPEAYCLRFLEDDDGHLPIYDMPPLDVNKKFGEYGIDTVVICDNKRWKPRAMTSDIVSDTQKQRTNTVLERETSYNQIISSQNKVLLKIHFVEKGIESITRVQFSPESTLKEVLESIAVRRGITNTENYRFIKFDQQKTNNTKPTEKNEGEIKYDMDALSLNLQIKNLTSTELVLEEKLLCDMPAKRRALTNTFDMQRSLTARFEPKGSSNEITRTLTSKEFSTSRDSQSKTESDFLFTDLSARKLQEFEVIKINQRGKKQKRVLGIDDRNIYNERPSKASLGSIIPSVFKTTKTAVPVRPLETVESVGRIDAKTVFIAYKEPKKISAKKRVYECVNPADSSEIIAKLNFLLDLQKKKAQRNTIKIM